MRVIALTVLVLCPGIAVAQQSRAPAAREIGELLVAIERSGCRFHRNGTWHDAREASRHLKRKYDYLEGKRRITDTESFIRLAASKSSVTGKPYMIQCLGAASVASEKWLTDKLAVQRGVGAKR